MYRLVIILLVVISASSLAAEESEPIAPAFCSQLYRVATSALHHKNIGTPKKILLSALPSREELIVRPLSEKKLLGLAMVNVAEEVYEFEDLDQKSYSAYTAELCHRRVQGKKVPESFEDAYPLLKRCKALPESERIACGMSVAGSRVDGDS